MKAKVKLGIAAALVAFVIGTSVALGDRPLLASSRGEAPSDTLRLGYFPNLNHAQAVIGVGNGDYGRALGSGIKLEPQLFNAGPAAIEALKAGRIDCAYVGPNPAINGYLTSNMSIKTIAGVSSGGAVLVVRSGAGINSPADFAGKAVASPQLGNTQDVAFRMYLKEHGYDVRPVGGDPVIQAAKPADMLTSMRQGRLDAAWVPEPWGARLVREAGARIFVDERDLWPGGRFATSLLVCREPYVEANPRTVEHLLEAHVDKTLWIAANPEQTLKAFNSEIKGLLGAPFDERDLRESLNRIEFTYDPLRGSVEKVAGDAYRLGLLGDERPDLSGMFDLKALNSVLERRGLAQVS